MQDRIILKGMTFYGHHGCSPEEQQVGQRIGVDVELALDLSVAGRTDAITDTVDYPQVYELVERIVTTKRFQLMEALAEDIAQSILMEFSKVEKVQVEVRKTNVPIAAGMEWMGVVVVREGRADG